MLSSHMLRSDHGELVNSYEKLKWVVGLDGVLQEFVNSVCLRTDWVIVDL